MFLLLQECHFSLCGILFCYLQWIFRIELFPRLASNALQCPFFKLALSHCHAFRERCKWPPLLQAFTDLSCRAAREIVQFFGLLEMDAPCDYSRCFMFLFADNVQCKDSRWNRLTRRALAYFYNQFHSDHTSCVLQATNWDKTFQCIHLYLRSFKHTSLLQRPVLPKWGTINIQNFATRDRRSDVSTILNSKFLGSSCSHPIGVFGTRLDYKPRLKSIFPVTDR